MANHLLTYYAILSSVSIELDGECDQAAYDNGVNVSVKEARPEALEMLDRHIRRLQELRADVEKMALSKLEAKWGGGDDDY